MNDIPQILFVVLWISMVVFAFTIMAQGWAIERGRYGYSKRPNVKHPEMNDVPSGEPLMSVNFNKLPDDDYSSLQDRIDRIRLEENFDEEENNEGRDNWIR